MDLNALTASATNGAVIPYNAATEFVDTAYTTFSTFFTNTHSADCGALSCNLYATDCSASYTGGKVKMSAVGLLSVVQNVQLGYSETLCVKCANTASKDTISKQWNIIQQRDCAVVLGNESPVTYTSPIIGYVPKDPCLVKRPLDASITLEYCKPDS